ncbi:hypothetical protein COCSUDRAFT_57566 [Coccomyxa subellipsoidea C-169]|uniref:BZIP domain-containing protein n=1 Tax=Coccomyxa subellipsoidea (strain C-169) TaxID=574566 RepID=I0YPU9_COCSC|nr:hypothetical protein COCSUDRAFT_57566 [Coccomyxa subellipsoidea C-169]EIE20418.1 hypothetical protein COCSUDRAFT_57566 [Coccomyxa subellipsoidea C-169]|eukprot:XP_005644962.1 hypothetical protein COCSUDRAFT_57566 [Coccomyxa subellipsoidea C-169]
MERQRSARLSGPVADSEWRLALSRNFKNGPNGRRVMPVKRSDGSSSDDKEGAQGVDPNDVMSQREYNRRAQQKCRERQKQKLKLSESRAQELQKALEALKLEKSVLVAHNELLQRMVGLHGNSPQPLQPPPHSDEAYSQGSAERDPEEAGINAESHNRSVTPETWAPAQEMIHLSIRTGCLEVARAGEALVLSMEQFKTLSVGELAMLWRDYVSAMAGLLPDARAAPGSAANLQVVQLAREMRLVVSNLMSASPKHWSTLRAVKMDPAGGAPVMETPPPNWWRKVYQAMELSDEQRAAAVIYRNHMLLRMGDTLRARQDIYLKFLRRQEGPCPELFVDDPQGGIALAQGLLAAGDVAEELRQNVALEQQLHNEFLLAVRSKLDPLQSATAIVHHGPTVKLAGSSGATDDGTHASPNAQRIESYPWCPEALAIVNCAADELGAPPAHELLGCPVRVPPAATGATADSLLPLPPGSTCPDWSLPPPDWAPADIEWLQANLGMHP